MVYPLCSSNYLKTILPHSRELSLSKKINDCGVTKKKKKTKKPPTETAKKKKKKKRGLSDLVRISNVHLVGHYGGRSPEVQSSFVQTEVRSCPGFGQETKCQKG